MMCSEVPLAGLQLRRWPFGMAMRAPLRRKSPAAPSLGAARLIALLAALAAGGVTYVSVQSLGQLVLQLHSGVVAAGVGATLSSGAGWKETWRLASELGTGDKYSWTERRNLRMCRRILAKQTGRYSAKIAAKRVLPQNRCCMRPRPQVNLL